MDEESRAGNDVELGLFAKFLQLHHVTANANGGDVHQKIASVIGKAIGFLYRKIHVLQEQIVIKNIRVAVQHTEILHLDLAVEKFLFLLGLGLYGFVGHIQNKMLVGADPLVAVHVF